MKRKILYWIPRILSIIAILFVVIFSLDVFTGNEPLVRKLLGFLMHNIPALILTCILVVAWKWELAGGISFIAAAVAGSIFFMAFSGNPGVLIIMAPFLIVGLLFLIHHLLYHKVQEF